MNDDLCVLVTLLETHNRGHSLLRCALKIPHGLNNPDIDTEFLRESTAVIEKLLPEHVRSVGPIVEIERIFEVHAA